MPGQHPTQIGQRQIGGPVVALILDFIEQPDDLAAAQFADRHAANGRINQPLEGVLAHIGGAQLRAFAFKINLANRLDGIDRRAGFLGLGGLLGCRRIAALSEFVERLPGCLASRRQRDMYRG